MDGIIDGDLEGEEDVAVDSYDDDISLFSLLLKIWPPFVCTYLVRSPCPTNASVPYESLL